MHRIALAAVAVLSVSVLAPDTARASPGFDFKCYQGPFEAEIGLDIGWENAFVTIGVEEMTLKSAGKGGQNSFHFAGDTFSFVGAPPEGQLKRDGETVSQCFQTRDSVKTLALYGSDNRPGEWSSYNVMGEGFQSVRAAPSVLSKKIDTIPHGEPVVILENTDEFLDGFFWFKIEYSEGLQGYMWGALLCTDADNPELNATLRRCSQ